MTPRRSARASRTPSAPSSRSYGGTIVDRQGNDYTQNQDFSSMLNAVAGQFDVVYFGGTQVTGGGQLRKQMGQAGLLDIPLVGPDGITDLARAAQKARSSRSPASRTPATCTAPSPASMTSPIRTRSRPPTRRCSERRPRRLQRPGVRVHAGPAPVARHRHQGWCRRDRRRSPPRGGPRERLQPARRSTPCSARLIFDANGDSSQKWISFYKTDPTLERRQGWLDLRQAAELRRVRARAPPGRPRHPARRPRNQGPRTNEGRGGRLPGLVISAPVSLRPS